MIKGIFSHLHFWYVRTVYNSTDEAMMRYYSYLVIKKIFSLFQFYKKRIFWLNLFHKYWILIHLLAMQFFDKQTDKYFRRISMYFIMFSLLFFLFCLFLESRYTLFFFLLVYVLHMLNIITWQWELFKIRETKRGKKKNEIWYFAVGVLLEASLFSISNKCFRSSHCYRMCFSFWSTFSSSHCIYTKTNIVCSGVILVFEHFLSIVRLWKYLPIPYLDAFRKYNFFFTKNSKHCWTDFNHISIHFHIIHKCISSILTKFIRQFFNYESWKVIKKG